MKNWMKILGGLLLALIAVCGASLLTDRSTYTNWTLDCKAASPSWAKFEWIGDSLNGRFVEKTALFVPCRVDGIPNVVTFQLDLGASLTGIYETTFASFYATEPALAANIKRLRSRLQFWNNNRAFDNLFIRFGGYIAINPTAFVYKNYGETIGAPNPNDTIHLGTIGADLFKNKVLLIDYPNAQFAICDQIPEGYSGHLVDIELDKAGRVILPMTIRHQKCRILFDTGSSLFPLITRADNMATFSSSADLDTLSVTSWGKVHNVTGKLIQDTFELAGNLFSHVKIYANHSGLGIDPETDGMAGNALFWDKTVVIDFRNKKFGVR